MNGSVQAYANHSIGQQMLLHLCTCSLRTNFCSQTCHSISNSMHSIASVSHLAIPQNLSFKQWNLRGRLHMVGRDCKEEEAQGRKGKSRITTNATHHTTEGNQDWMMKKTTDPYSVLGISPDCNDDDIKAAFRNRVKEFHPDVYKGPGNADAITQRLIRAYQLLTNDVERTAYRKSTDPFDDPECEAEDVFVNELNCIGQGCPYSCVARAPDVFSFAANTGCARAVSQGTGQDYRVQLAVGQCPRNCIHWVTPLQRTVLEDILEQALQGTMFSTEALMLEALVARAKYENGRYQPPKQKRKPKGSNEWVDWF
ncbi:hypothetical protein CY35_01G095000 [Sphagnum magellanicum]|nr:hypothetical protein CY35_01G095000 [Sphagnum magellanicum]KAH9575115.1 hypothetical protein CY35_01G095000 [Sphagnum magellanicum]KAH9575116.1 hypothetical protein CY35_01G095000 [Sphagnum magellanicum]